MNWKNYCIVKFDTTNEFAIRKGWFIYKYLDLNNLYFWWGCRDKFFRDCITKEENKIRIIFDRLINKDKGTVVFKP